MRVSATTYFSNPYTSLYILILMNLIPAYGVLFAGWNAFDLVIVYILETIVIGLMNIVKMASSTAFYPENSDISKQKGGGHWLKFILIPFFVLHYFLFVGVQSVFVFVLLGNQNLSDISELPMMFTQLVQNNKEISMAVLSMVASHSFSFVKNFIGNGEYATIFLPKLMFLPYIRIFIQQFVVLVGALLMAAFNAPETFVIVLVVLKILTDSFMHLKIHRKFIA